MVQVRGDDISGGQFSTVYNKFTSCRLHDLMRDLCLSKGEKEGFIKVMDLSQEGKISSSINSATADNNDIRRLAIRGNSEVHEKYILSHDLKLKTPLRSLLIGGTDIEMRIRIERITNDLNKVKFLKTLKLENCEFEYGKLPSEVGKLIHLRYLSLFGSNVAELPLSVCSFPYLQTLDLRFIWLRPIVLPNAIFKMKRLRHLFLSEFQVNGDVLLILDGLKELETLVCQSSRHARITDLPRLTNLKLLDISVHDYETLSVVIHQMTQLRETCLSILDIDLSTREEELVLLRKMLMSHSLITLWIEVRIGFNFPCYQPGMCPNLVKLELWDSEIEGEVMQELDNFPVLKSLVIGGNTFIGTEMICYANAFPQLKHLSLKWLPNLEKWAVDQGAMPNLSYLEIWKCTKLEMIPDGLRFITTLQELTTRFMPKRFNKRLLVANGEPGQDYHKVRHIPSITLFD